MTATATDLGLVPGTWSIDQSHSSIEFLVRHLMVSKVRGYFGKFEGSATVAEDLTTSAVAVTIQTESISTRDDARDNHLRGTDFFETEKYPTITFASTTIEPKGGDWRLIGDLTIRGVTKSIEFDLEFNGTQPDPYGGLRAGLSATGELSRKEFGLEWNAALETGGVMVGDRATLNVEIELVKVAE
ncbi:MAG: YceI family protein [Ferrimicrobium sp.]